MPPISLPKSISTYRTSIRVLLFAGIAAFTGWVTFTTYSAKLDRAKADTPPTTGSSVTKPAGTAGRVNFDKNYGKLPLTFEANVGQTDASVKYIARGPGYNIFLTPAEAVLVLPGSANSDESSAETEEAEEPGIGPGFRRRQFERMKGDERTAADRTPTVVRLQLVGASQNAQAVEGRDELSGKVNYIFGNDSSKWLTSIPTYAKVAYSNVYPGVDLVYYGNQQQLEYDLVVAPGADPNLIQIKFDGAESLRVDKQGNLLIKTKAGEIRQGKPTIFQEVNGARKQVDGGYVLKQGNKIGFKVSRYDRRKRLVIDPILNYLSFVNTRGRGFAIAVDPSGFAYITGSIDAGDQLPAAPGAFQIAGGGLQDVFVTKLNQEGNGVLYSTYLGGNDDEDAYGIAVDPTGNAYITGYASGTFPTTPGAYKTTLAVGFDAFVTKLNPTGSGLVYSTFFGGLNFEECDGIVVDAAGNAYVAGLTESLDMPTTPGAVQTTNNGGTDAFIAGFNATGSGLLYATYLGGGGLDFGLNLAVDSASNIFAVGQTSSLNFPTASALQLPSGTDRGFFKSSSGGSSWSLSRNGLTNGFINALAIAPNAPSALYAGTHGGVYKSTDIGANWAATGTLSGGNVQTLAVDPSDGNIVYAGTPYGVFKTTNGGNSWSAMNNGLTFNQIPVFIRSLAIDRNAPATVYAGSQGSGVFKSTNGGGSWVQINTGLTNFGMRAVVIDPANSATVYALANARVFKSTNDGTNWTQITTGLPSVNTYRTLAIDPLSPATLYVGGGVGIYKTTNGGTNWNAVNNNLLLPYTDNVGRLPLVVTLALDPVTPTTVYAGAANSFTLGGAYPLTAVLKSTDGGANWTAFTNGFSNLNTSVLALVIDPTNSANIYAGTSGDAEAFVTKLSPGNTVPLFSSYLGGARSESAVGVTLDSFGNAYIVGRTGSTNFPATAGAFQTALRGANDAFVAKLNATNNAPVFATYLGGGSTEDGHGVALDPAGNVYVAGRTTSPDFPTTAGSFQTKIGNPGDATKSDVFITKLNQAGNALSYSSYLGGGGDEAVSPFNLQLLNTIGLDALGNAYVVGITSDPSTFPAFDFVNVNNNFGTHATFVAKVNAGSLSYSITGRLTTAANAPIAGVFVEASNGQGLSRGAVSDSQGFFSLISLPAGDYVVTPSRFGTTGHFIFSPTSRTFTGLNSDQTANFTGTQVFDIQGRVTSSTVPGLGIFDVTVTLSGAASATVITDAEGNYSFQDLLPGNYTVTPTKAGFTFNPVNRTFTNLNADQFGADFTTASTTFFTVSGRIADTANISISNVVISMVVLPQRGSRVLTTQTDANGNYSFPNLQAGGNYTFTPVKPLLSFTPQSPTLSNLSANQTLNFTATAVTGLVGKIAFSRRVSDEGDIFVMNADGTGEINLTNTLAGEELPAWSPDGSKIVFASNRDAITLGNFSDIYVMNANGTGVTRLTNLPFEDTLPSWSPDGTQITFTSGNLECSSSEFGAPPDVFVMGSDGSSPRSLTNSVLPDGFSDWSPAGSSIAFIRLPTGDCSNGEANIFAMDPAGGNERLLANSSEDEIGPAYSPDGARIAYFRGFDFFGNSSIQSIWVMNADGTGQTKISPDLQITEESRPTWSPDGTKVAFSGNLRGATEPDQIFVINADGTGLAQITSGTARRSGPSWQHYSISGRVNGNTNGLPVTMVLAGTLTRVTQTDPSGNYVFGNLTPGGNYTVTPVSTAFVFTPAKTDINNLVGNQIANFTLVPQAIPTPTPPLADDFTDAQRDPAKWNVGTQTQPLGAFDSQVTVLQQSGQLVITPRTNSSGLHYNGYVAVNSFDFENGTATVEVAQTATGGADTIFAIGSDLDNFSRFVVRAGDGAPGVFSPLNRGRSPSDVTVPQLIFQVRVSGQLTSLSIPYDAVEHRYMRFRHEPLANAIVFETSRDKDNVPFTERHRVTLVRSVSALTAELSAGTSTATDPPGQTVFDNFQLVTNTFQFSAASFSVDEGVASAQVSVTRTGNVATPATVEYFSFDESATQRTKYILATGVLSFAPGEPTKSFGVLIVDNLLVEGNQTLSLRLIDSSGSGLNSPGRAVLTIVDNDTTPPTSNPLDHSDALFFVREHYYDFLSREPDASGFAFWANEITSCGTNVQCREVKRINVSAAYFLSIEFQQTGFLVHRFYNAALNRANGLPRYLEFLRDTQSIGRGVVVGATGWEALLEANRAAYADQFVIRPEFTSLYPSTMTPTQFVDALYAHALIVPNAAERQAAIDEFSNPTGARGRALRRVVENQTLRNREFNRAFVLAQYFGYLRRNPDDPPDNNLNGYNFWLGKLNQFNGDFVGSEMVKAFIVSGEYRQRFGP